jgi:hypothetical protein
MPDSFEHMPTVAIRMPNGALISLAGNVDQNHSVAVADLVLCQRTVRETVTRLVREIDPELVGLCQISRNSFVLMPFLKRRRCCRSNLNDGPVSNQCSCCVSIRQWTAHDEMIVAMHVDAYRVISCGSFDAERRGSGTG